MSGDHVLYSHDLNVWFSSDIVKANLHAAICRADLLATTNRGANRLVWMAIRCARDSNPTSRPIQKNLWLLHRFSRVGPDLKDENAICKELAQNKLYLWYFSWNKLTSYHLLFCFPKRVIKVLTLKSACAVLALYINRVASRFIVADKSGPTNRSV